MKTRKALVSNSSSSSFIVVFPRKPKSIEEVHDIMFNGIDGHIHSCYDEKESMSFIQIAEVVFNDCKDKKIATMKELVEEFTTLTHHDLYKFEDEVRKSGKIHSIQMMLDFGIEYGAEINALCDVVENNERLRQQESSERKELMAKFGIYDYLTGKEPQEFKDADSKLRQKHWEIQKPGNKKYTEIIESIAQKKAKEFADSNKGWWYTILTYEDHTQTGSFMEHQNVFRHVQNIRISHH